MERRKDNKGRVLKEGESQRKMVYTSIVGQISLESAALFILAT